MDGRNQKPLQRISQETDPGWGKEEIEKREGVKGEKHKRKHLASHPSYANGNVPMELPEALLTVIVSS